MIVQTEKFYKCPECGAVASVNEELDPGEAETCLECETEVDSRNNPAIWEEFWAYCQSLKDI